MKKKRFLLLLILPLLFFAVVYFAFGSRLIINSGLTTQRKVLENSQQFILYSLDPSSIFTTGDAAEDRKLGLNVKGKETFHRYRVLGKSQITDSKVKAKIISALYGGIDEGGSWGILCFNPRHGIRAVSGNQTVDLVICFECQKIDVNTNLRSGRVYTSSSPQKVFDRALIDAKVPLGKRPDIN